MSASYNYFTTDNATKNFHRKPRYAIVTLVRPTHSVSLWNCWKRHIGARCTRRVSEWAWSMYTPKHFSTIPWGVMSPMMSAACTQLPWHTMSCYYTILGDADDIADSVHVTAAAAAAGNDVVQLTVNITLLKLTFRPARWRILQHTVHTCRFTVTYFCCPSNTVMLLHKTEKTRKPFYRRENHAMPL